MNLTIYASTSIQKGIKAIREVDGRRTRVLRLVRRTNGTSLERYLRLWLLKYEPQYLLFQEYERVSEELRKYESAGLLADEIGENYANKLRIYASAIERFEDTFKTYEVKKANLPEALSSVPIHPDLLKQLEVAKAAIGPDLYAQAEQIGLQTVAEALVFEKSEFLDKTTNVKKLELKLKKAEETDKELQVAQLKRDFASAKEAKEAYIDVFVKNNVPFSEEGKQLFVLANLLRNRLNEENTTWVVNEFFANARRHASVPEVLSKLSLAKSRLEEARINFDYFEKVATPDLQKCLNAHLQTGLMASYVRSSSGASRMVKDMFGAEMEIDQICTSLRTALQYRELKQGVESNTLLNFLNNLLGAESESTAVLEQLINLRKHALAAMMALPKDEDEVKRWVKAAFNVKDIRQEFEDKGRKLINGLGWNVYSEDNIVAGIEKARGYLLSPNLISPVYTENTLNLKVELEKARKEVEQLNTESTLAKVFGQNPFEKLDEIYKLNTLFEVIRLAELPPEHAAIILSEGNLAQIGVLESIKEKILEQRKAMIRLQAEVGDLFGLPRLKDGLMNVRVAIQEFLSNAERVKTLAAKRTALEVGFKGLNTADLDRVPKIKAFHQSVQGKVLNAEFVSELCESEHIETLTSIAEVVLILKHELAIDKIRGNVIEITDQDDSTDKSDETTELDLEDMLVNLSPDINQLSLAPAELKSAIKLSSIDEMFSDEFIDEPLSIQLPSERDTDVPLPFKKPSVSKTSAFDNLKMDNFEEEEIYSKEEILSTELKPQEPEPTPQAQAEPGVGNLSSAEALFDDAPATGRDARIGKYLEKYSSHKTSIKDWKSGNRGGR